jgi:hypothetical protein
LVFGLFALGGAYLNAYPSAGSSAGSSFGWCWEVCRSNSTEEDEEFGIGGVWVRVRGDKTGEEEVAVAAGGGGGGVGDVEVELVEMEVDVAREAEIDFDFELEAADDFGVDEGIWEADVDAAAELEPESELEPPWLRRCRRMLELTLNARPHEGNGHR